MAIDRRACYPYMANEIVSLSDFRAGARMAHGRNCSATLLKMLINRLFLWMARFLGHMLGLPGRQTAETEALGCSKGGFDCKVHALCDALGMPIKFILTCDQEAECKQALLVGKHHGIGGVSG